MQFKAETRTHANNDHVSIRLTMLSFIRIKFIALQPGEQSLAYGQVAAFPIGNPRKQQKDRNCSSDVDQAELTRPSKSQAIRVAPEKNQLWKVIFAKVLEKA
eukprot:6461573-Amphidinium_carterae.2